MLYRHSEVLRTSLLIADLSIIAGTWLLSYWVRFYTVFDAPLGVPALEPYTQLLAVILPLWLLLFRARGLYDAQRTGSLLNEMGQVVSATAMGTVLLVATTFFVRSYFYSRGVMLLFFAFSCVSVVSFRLSGRLLLRALRRRGYNLRHLLLVGGGELTEEVVARVHAHPETGLRIVGALTADGDEGARVVGGVPVLGRYGSLKDVIRRHGVQQVIVALPRDEGEELEKLLADLEDEVVTVRMVPDLSRLATLKCSVEDLDGLPVINLREGPLVGWSAVKKRAFDVAVAALALIVTAPVMAAIALAIRITSGRPVLYGQLRMGLDGRTFRMLKFRTMVESAESDSGPVWATADDPRRTRLGGFLRRNSLDELPQLWNVLRGQMSLVGPRPERPFFIEQFRREIPGYMLRHKVKAGLTGWAQVHGWRGNTSLHERVEHDIYYVQNWSIGLDLRILLMTLLRGAGRRGAA